MGMDAGGRPGLGGWWWLRQGPGSRCAGAQDQQQAAFEGAESRVRKGGIPETRPGSPIDLPTPRADCASKARPEAHASPTYGHATRPCGASEQPPMLWCSASMRPSLSSIGSMAWLNEERGQAGSGVSLPQNVVERVVLRRQRRRRGDVGHRQGRLTHSFTAAGGAQRAGQRDAA